MEKIMNYFKKLNNKKGFTLIELIVVIAILAILVLLAAPKFMGYTKDADAVAMKADAKVISDAALMYNIDNDGAWPVVDSDDVTEGLQGITTSTLTELDTALGSTVATVYDIDETALDSYIKSIQGDFSDYVIDIVTGEVYHKAGVPDKAEATWFSPSLVVEKP